MKIDGMDDAFVGVCMTWNGNMLVERVVYDGRQITDILTRDGMSSEEAQDYIDFNIIGAYVGDSTPIVMWPCSAGEFNECS